MAKRSYDRRALHIMGLSKSGSDRAFLPQSRMRHIRWEEAVTRSQALRAGVKKPTITHTHCHCGSIECLGVPFIPPPPFIPGISAP